MDNTAVYTLVNGYLRNYD